VAVFGQSVGSTALGLATLLCTAAASSRPLAQAQAVRTARDGVYSVEQAARGETLYQTRCAVCHGETLTGGIGPPLVGESFLGIWGPRPLSDLFDKISGTMPVDAPGTLTRTRVTDIVAFALRANQFPAGTTVLGTDEAALQQIVLAAPATGGPSPAASIPLFPAVGNLNQVMRGILFPSSNVLFDVQTQDPGAQKPGARADAATTTGRYGGVYDAWTVVDAAAISLAEVGPLLMTPGRRCENGKPVPVDRSDWQRYVQGLVDVGRAAYRAAQTRSQASVAEVTSAISDACASCHRVYRDSPSAALRCTPP
jgi:mono/diheme cytochrome c family protein